MKVNLPISELVILREFVKKNIDLEIDNSEILKSALILLYNAENESEKIGSDGYSKLLREFAISASKLNTGW